MTSIATEPAPARSRLPLWARLAAVPAVAALLVGGLWLVAGELAPGGYDGSILAGIAWFVAAGLALNLLGRRVPALRLPLRATFLATALVVAGAAAWTSLRDTTVSERVAVGTPLSQAAGGAPGNLELSRGAFTPLAHRGGGEAAVVRLADGDLRLTLLDLDTDPGPDLRVILVAGPVSDDLDGDGYLDLGALKGNQGTQQYAIPAGTDLDRYGTVVIWCRAFSVAFAQAPLAAS